MLSGGRPGDGSRRRSSIGMHGPPASASRRKSIRESKKDSSPATRLGEDHSSPGDDGMDASSFENFSFASIARTKTRPGVNLARLAIIQSENEARASPRATPTAAGRRASSGKPLARPASISFDGAAHATQLAWTLTRATTEADSVRRRYSAAVLEAMDAQIHHMTSFPDVDEETILALRGFRAAAASELPRFVGASLKRLRSSAQSSEESGAARLSRPETTRGNHELSLALDGLETMIAKYEEELRGWREAEARLSGRRAPASTATDVLPPAVRELRESESRDVEIIEKLRGSVRETLDVTKTLVSALKERGLEAERSLRDCTREEERVVESFRLREGLDPRRPKAILRSLAAQTEIGEDEEPNDLGDLLQ